MIWILVMCDILSWHFGFRIKNNHSMYPSWQNQINPTFIYIFLDIAHVPKPWVYIYWCTRLHLLVIVFLNNCFPQIPQPQEYIICDMCGLGSPPFLSNSILYIIMHSVSLQELVIPGLEEKLQMSYMFPL